MGMDGPVSAPGCRGICKDLTVLEEGLDNNNIIGDSSGILCPVPGEDQLLH